MENLDHDPVILTRRSTDDQLPSFITHATPTTRSHEYSRTLQHIYRGTFFIVYVSLIGLIQVKFQTQNNSPFDTHGFFIIMSLAALPVAITTSGLLFHALENQNITNLSPVHYMLLKFGFNLSAIVAVVSLVIVLFVPCEVKWIGYVIVVAVFAIMVGYYLYCYVILVKKKDGGPNFVGGEMV